MTDQLLASLGYAGTEYDPTKSAPEVEELSFDAKEVHDTARESLDFLAAIAVPDKFKYAFPPVFQSVWIWLRSFINLTRAFPQLALGLPRGFGKTTLIKIFILFCILFTRKKFILVISATATLAENVISDVIDMLDQPNIKAVFGDWRIGLEKDTQELKKFGFRGRNIILAGVGAGGSIRGLNLKNERPDLMIFEDIQKREDAESQKLSEDLMTWMLSTAMKAKDPEGCMFIFVANMYPTKGSILRKLKYNPAWVKFIAGGILSDGSSLWEDLQPISQLMQEFQNDLTAGHPEIFYSEVLNDENATQNNLIDIAKIPSYAIPDDDISAGSFIIIDPASGKAAGDAVSIGAFDIHDSIPVLKELKEDRYSPGDTIRIALEMAMRRRIYLIAIEGNAYQSTLCYWFQFICQQMGIEGIEAVEIYSGTYSKNHRIITMFRSLLAGELRYHPSVAAPVNLQITQFNPLKNNNTDGILDLLAYAPKVLELFGTSILAHSTIDMQDWVAAKVLSHNSPF